MGSEADIVESFENLELVEGPVFVSEEAALAVGAVESVLEGGADLGLVLGIGRLKLLHELLVAVGELALVAVPADAHLDPVLAHLRFVLGLVCLKLLAQVALLSGVEGLVFG